MGLVGQDRGELHTRNRGISRWVTIQWPSHKSCGTASTDVVRGAAGIVGTCCSAGGPTMTRDNGVRRVFTSCAHRQIHGPIQPSVVLKQCHDGRVAPWVLAGHESAAAIYWTIKRLIRSDQPDRTPRLARLSKSLLLCENEEAPLNGLINGLSARSYSKTIRIIPLTPPDS